MGHFSLIVFCITSTRTAVTSTHFLPIMMNMDLQKTISEQLKTILRLSATQCKSPMQTTKKEGRREKREEKEEEMDCGEEEKRKEEEKEEREEGEEEKKIEEAERKATENRKKISKERCCEEERKRKEGEARKKREEEKPYKCEVCGKRFRSEEGCIDHKKDTHKKEWVRGEEKERKGVKAFPSSPHQCTDGEEQSLTARSEYREKIEKEEEEKREEEEREEEKREEEKREEHASTTTTIHPPLSSPALPTFHCMYCHKRFTSQQGIRDHESVCRLRPSECRENASSTSRYKKRGTIQTHAGERKRERKGRTMNLAQEKTERQEENRNREEGELAELNREREALQREKRELEERLKLIRDLQAIEEKRKVIEERVKLLRIEREKGQ